MPQGWDRERDRWATVVIPTRDSAQWIGALLAHYKQRDVVPVILLDCRTTDNTAAIARQHGCPIVDIAGFTFTEAIVSVTARCVQTPWALFMHDDEVPSGRLFARLAGPPPPDAAQSVAIPRRWAWHAPGQPLTYGRSDQWQDRTHQPGTDHAWRLFRPRDVEFIAKMHTEGFIIDRWSRVPLDAYFVHFEWIIRSHSQRQAKLRKYDRHRFGYGQFFEKVYLPESQPAGVIEYRLFETDEFDGLACTYAAVAKHDVVVPPRTLWDRIRAPKGLSSLIREKIGIIDFSREDRDRIGLTPQLDREIVDPYPAGQDSEAGFIASSRAETAVSP